MIRRTPCEFYIKYLLVHPDGYTEEDIKHTVREHQLDWPGGNYLARLRRRVNPPDPFHPYDDRHRASYRFLTEHKLHTMFHQDKTTLAAIKMLNKPRAKEAVEAMFLVQDSPRLICARLKQMGYPTTPEILQRYSHFFFNLELVDSTEMRALLRMRIENMIDDGDSTINIKQRDAMKQANYLDPRHAAVHSPILPLAGMMNQMRYGYMPSNVDTARIAKSAQVSSLIRAQQVMSVPGPQSPAQALNFALVAKNMGEVMEQIGSPDDELNRDLALILLDTDTSQPPMIEVLSEGEHTSDMQLLRERNDDDE